MSETKDQDKEPETTDATPAGGVHIESDSKGDDPIEFQVLLSGVVSCT